MDRLLIFLAGAGCGALAGRWLNANEIPFPAKAGNAHRRNGETREILAKTQVLLKEIRSLVLHADIPDAVLEKKVKAKLARQARHPDLINVQVTDGAVMLRGRAAPGEAADLVESLAMLRGVKSVEDRLEASPREGGPGYRGASGKARAAVPSGMGKRAGYPASVSILMSLGGLSLAAGGFRRRGVPGSLCVAGGAALLGAGIAGLLPHRREGIFERTVKPENGSGEAFPVGNRGRKNGTHGIQDMG